MPKGIGYPKKRGHAKKAGKVNRPSSAAARSVHNSAEIKPVTPLPKDSMRTMRGKAVKNPRF